MLISIIAALLAIFQFSATPSQIAEAPPEFQYAFAQYMRIKVDEIPVHDSTRQNAESAVAQAEALVTGQAIPYREVATVPTPAPRPVVVSTPAPQPVTVVAQPRAPVQAAPVVVATVVQAQSSGTLESAIQASPWPASTWARLRAVIQCESRGILTARNGPHYGILQANVNLWGYPGDTYASQLAHGYHIFQVQGWAAWECA